MSKHTSRKRRGLKTKARIRLSDRARLVVYRSDKHIYAQIISDEQQVIVSSSTIDKELKTSVSGKKKVEQAVLVGKLLGKRALESGVTKVAFDRAGYKYHGRVKALADAAREAGLNF